MPKRSFWGWGYEEVGPDPGQLAAAEAALPSLLQIAPLSVEPAPRLEDIELRAPRIQPTPAIARLLSDDRFERASHTYGKSYRDLVRGYAGAFENPPDYVAFPESEADVAALLDFCDSARAAAVIFGGGSSVCGGVEAPGGDRFRGVVSIDLARLDKVVEVDMASRAARIQAGIFGPALERGLREHGLSLRHYPQSFEFSTLGGWIATRSGGHFATGPTHIDELVECLRVVTPSGIISTRRLPGDGAGPSPDRLFMGSEGALGVICEAWMRVFERPRFRAKASVRFPDFAHGLGAVRALGQSGLMPSNCRLLDPLEAMMNGAAGGDAAVLMLGFESGDHNLDAWGARAAQLCRDHGGVLADGALRTRHDDAQERDAAEGAWRAAFLRAPYLRDALVARGIFVETFETAVTWDGLEALHRKVVAAAQAAAGENGQKSLVSCRITHAYPDGAAPYFTVITPARVGHELEQWRLIKTAVTDAMLEAGGTTTHHHAVGRDFRPWYERQTPKLVLSALLAAKRELDPAGILNPGVLLPEPT
ncbi:MAG: FAD-binding oxidoreductase [Myxococcales bacterium]|nr:FAD-binding oxidoreductase [Myxococcales bacterium]